MRAMRFNHSFSFFPYPGVRETRQVQPPGNGVFVLKAYSGNNHPVIFVVPFIIRAESRGSQAVKGFLGLVPVDIGAYLHQAGSAAPGAGNGGVDYYQRLGCEETALGGPAKDGGAPYPRSGSASGAGSGCEEGRSYTGGSGGASGHSQL